MEKDSKIPLEGKFTSLNLNAAEFVPNVGATEFVPSWITPAPAAPAATTVPTDTSAISDGNAKEPKAPIKEIVEKSSKEALASKSSPPPKPKVVEKVQYDPATDDSKEHLNIVFMGHVDAGKSTMGGHILLLTGMVDKRTMEKYEREAKELGRESWYLSWALDLNSEERAKGKTTEYGRGYFETEKRRYTILDAPGHKNFVPSMIGGASQADVGVLVISARKGEFETGFERGGQTREHAMLAKTAGVKKLIMVINKMDDQTVEWSKERYHEIVGKISPFLKGVGYQKSGIISYSSLDLIIMPISGYSGANLKDRVSKEVCPWYDGPSMLELLDDMDISDRDYNAPFMMPIADKFKDMGTVVIGKIESGMVSKGQTVMIMPNKKIAEVLTILQEDEEVNMAKCGDNIRLRLKNVEEEDVLSGFVICSPNDPVKSVSEFEAQLAILEYKSIICGGYTAVMHTHAAVEEITISDLLHMIDKKTGKKSKKPPKFIKQGDSCIVRIQAAQNVCVETYTDYPQLGRFTIRDEGMQLYRFKQQGKTVAVGKITKLIFNTD